MIILFKYFLIPSSILLVVLFAIGIYFYRDKDGYDLIGIKKSKD